MQNVQNIKPNLHVSISMDVCIFYHFCQSILFDSLFFFIQFARFSCAQLYELL